jgi:hypothetical protein
MSEFLSTAPLLTLLQIVGPILLLAALIYGTVQWSRRRRGADAAGEAATRRLYTDRTARADNVGTVPEEVGLVPKDERGLLTEDEMQRERLGPRGVPGQPDPARMTPQRKKKTPEKIDPGHTA